MVAGGLTTGVTRCLGQAKPAWLTDFPCPFAVLGIAVAWFLLKLFWSWWPPLHGPERHRVWYGLPPAQAARSEPAADRPA